MPGPRTVIPQAHKDQITRLSPGIKDQTIMPRRARPTNSKRGMLVATASMSPDELKVQTFRGSGAKPVKKILRPMKAKPPFAVAGIDEHVVEIA